MHMFVQENILGAKPHCLIVHTLPPNMSTSTEHTYLKALDAPVFLFRTSGRLPPQSSLYPP